ncbi:MAG: fatty oxidation complex, alpha subunit [Pseudobdellovibrio sp.]|nr:fatty oxidation complex, alpha subunit [Pseudobdellovibrio sp.]
MSAVNLTTQKVGTHEVAVLTFDLPGEKVNKLSTPVMSEFKAHIEKLKTSQYRMVVIKSAKPKIFIAGADIEEIKELKTTEQVVNAVKGGQEILNMLEDLPMPTMALINGACAGGGCELVYFTGLWRLHPFTSLSRVAGIFRCDSCR